MIIDILWIISLNILQQKKEIFEALGLSFVPPEER